ncbi:MAG: rhodoquinone biosynthesis methyltransferase RquA [Bradyrhizobiaceae bacterium]|nr:rhodoquinone biosynthesis methyltransferase RquA [Bradyrhizobiaceae bacterium]
MPMFPVARPCSPAFAEASRHGLAASPGKACDGIPAYLRTHYWWAYIHPLGVRLFERQWLVNLILWGNYGRLRDAALAELGDSLPGTTLQVACVYGDLTVRISRRAAVAGGTLDVVDVLPIQLRNLHDKLAAAMPVRLLAMDSTRLQLRDAAYDRALVFFLLHEQPEGVRRQTLHEVFRVVKPGGKVVIVDYARPRWWSPLRWLWQPVLAALEPFALDLWRDDVSAWMPAPQDSLTSRRFFGGLYQMVAARPSS